LQETRRITVTVEGELLPRLNELEYVDGKILANVWQTDFVVRLDPGTGIVDGVYDFSGLLAQAPPFDGAYDVLNGIAYDEQTGRLFVTGKLWPYLFEVETEPR
ncbi:MAG: glutaminyl-peptide cyclotransferase, partial [Caldilinea sp.]